MSESKEPEEVRSEELAALFERTARAPSEIERARLTARAAEMAELEGRNRLRARLVWPLALAAAGAIVYLVAAPEKKAPAPVAVASSARAAVPVIPQVVAPPVVPAAAPAPEDEADDPIREVFGNDPEDLETADLAPLFAMSDPDRREAALEAAEDQNEAEP